VSEVASCYELYRFVYDPVFEASVSAGAPSALEARGGHLSGNVKDSLVRGLPKMQGTQVEPGTSQFRRPWATSVARRISTSMRRPDLRHSRLFMPRLIPGIGFCRRPFCCSVPEVRPRSGSWNSRISWRWVMTEPWASRWRWYSCRDHRCYAWRGCSSSDREIDKAGFGVALRGRRLRSALTFPMIARNEGTKILKTSVGALIVVTSVCPKVFVIQ